MKKLLLVACAICLLGQAAFATITISASPSSQSVAAGGTFNVTFSLQVTQSSNPSTVAGIDLFLQALKSQNSVLDISNLFMITNQNVVLAGFLPAGPGNYPDSLKASNSSHGSNFVENLEDQAISASGNSTVKTTPFTTIAFETLTLSVAGNTPAGTYNFVTTTPSSNQDARGTHIVDNQGNYFIPNVQAAFSITITAVPEPATWSLLGLGGLGAIGITMLRRRRA